MGASSNASAQRCLIGGSSGLIGTALSAAWREAGHEVVRLARGRGGADPSSIPWDPAAGQLESGALEGFDAVVHLGGEGVVSGRWTEAKKRKILDSRVISTRLLAEGLARSRARPKVFICASAIGFYGDTGERCVDERAKQGEGFLAEVCDAWEDATRPAVDAGVRVVNVRIGLVLSPKGGALGAMLTPFRLGAGGVVGSGGQLMSWISLQDVVGAVQHIMQTEALSGPVNLTAPNPVNNRDFTRILASVLSRPAIVPAPAFALRLALGKEMANETVLASACVLPKALLDSGYAFEHTELEPTLRAILS